MEKEKYRDYIYVSSENKDLQTTKETSLNLKENKKTYISRLICFIKKFFNK
jgi:hypothetical protein